MPKFSPIQYLREAKDELAKVTWPSRKESTRNVLIVLIGSIAIALAFALLDGLLTAGLKALIALTR